MSSIMVGRCDFRARGKIAPEDVAKDLEALAERPVLVFWPFSFSNYAKKSRKGGSGYVTLKLMQRCVKLSENL